MPHNLTDANLFTAPVVVPDGDDDHMLLAEYIAAIAQALANRTFYLKPLADGAAQRTGGNTISGDQLLTGVLQVTQQAINAPAVQALVVATDAPNPGTNRWQWVFRIKTGGGQYANVYSGTDAAARGSLAITVNAIWDASSGMWSQLDAAQKSIALIWRYFDVRLVGMAAGSSPWALWPSSYDSSTTIELLAHRMTGKIVRAEANTDAAFDRGFRHVSAQPRTSMIPITGFQGKGFLRSDFAVMRSAVANIGDVVLWPIRVPPFCTFSEIRIAHWMGSDNSPTPSHNPDTFKLWRREHIGGAWAIIASATAADVVGDTTTAINTGNTTQSLDGTEFALEWTVVMPDAAGVANRVKAIEVDWTDIGPNNGIG
jgi:hypothetical protein